MTEQEDGAAAVVAGTAMKLEEAEKPSLTAVHQFSLEEEALAAVTVVVVAIAVTVVAEEEVVVIVIAATVVAVAIAVTAAEVVVIVIAATVVTVVAVESVAELAGSNRQLMNRLKEGSRSSCEALLRLPAAAGAVE